MPSFDDIEPSVKLNDNESFVGIFDRSKEVKQEVTEKFGTRYTLLFLCTDGPLKGRVCRVKGGSTFYDGVAKVIGTSQQPMKLKLTGKGQRGQMDYRILVEAVH